MARICASKYSHLYWMSATHFAFYCMFVQFLSLCYLPGVCTSFQQIDSFRHLLGEVKRQVMSAIG